MRRRLLSRCVLSLFGWIARNPELYDLCVDPLQKGVDVMRLPLLGSILVVGFATSYLSGTAFALNDNKGTRPPTQMDQINTNSRRFLPRGDPSFSGNKGYRGGCSLKPELCQELKPAKR